MAGVVWGEPLFLMTTNSKLTHTISGRVVAETQQKDAMLRIVFADGSAMEIKLEDAASSVMVRSAAGQMEYSD